jgi:hypothetical protein
VFGIVTWARTRLGAVGRRGMPLGLTVAVFLAGCGPGATATRVPTASPSVVAPESATAPSAEQSSSPTPSPVVDPVLLAAGDIAYCSRETDEITAAILAQYPDATVQTLGDNAYNSGTARQFGCFDDSWGIALDRMYPALGGHDYMTEGASGYFDYFKERLAPFAPTGNDPAQGWYAYDLGEWRIIVLNSICQHIGGCETGSPQVTWLTSEIETHRARCSLAVIHNPRFSSGRKGNEPEVEPLWDVLHAGGVEIVLSGDNHAYERLAPMTPTGKKDPAGIRQFVAGTGGGRPYLFSEGEIHRNSEARIESTFGLLKLTLTAEAYAWEFLPEAGMTETDSGREACH